jgi:hypothetical protein
MDEACFIDVKNSNFSKIIFLPKNETFEKNCPKNTFLPTWQFYIMPNLKVDISSFAMMHDLGVCGVGTLSRPKMWFRRSSNPPYFTCSEPAIFITIWDVM